MELVGAMVLVIVGVILMAADLRSLSLGYLPLGARWFDGGSDVWRRSNPGGFWCLFVLYAVGGGWAIKHGLATLTSLVIGAV